MLASLRRYLAVGLSLLLVGALGTLVVLADGQMQAASHRVHREDRARDQKMLANLTQQYLSFTARDLQALSLSRHWSMRPGDAGDRTALAHYAATSPFFAYSAVLTDLTGRVLTASSTRSFPAADDPAYTPLRAGLLAGKPGVSSVMSTAGRSLVAVAVPLVDGKRPVALIVGFADLRAWGLQDYVQRLDLGDGASYYVVDAAGRAVASSNPADVGKRVNVPRPTDGVSVDVSGGLVRSAAPVGLGGWTSDTTQSLTAFYATLSNGQGWMLIGLALGFVAAAAALIASEHRRQHALRALAQEAIFDPLTGAGTRRMLELRLPISIARARRAGGMVALFFCDLDDFKQVNDRLGHHVGDDVLVTATKVLRGCLREEDLLVRLGGDEFVIVIEGVTNEADVRRLARRIVRELAEPMRVQDRLVSLSVSVGVAVLPPDAPADTDLTAAADQAMYDAKRSGSGWEMVTIATSSRPEPPTTCQTQPTLPTLT